MWLPRKEAIEYQLKLVAAHMHGITYFSTQELPEDVTLTQETLLSIYCAASSIKIILSYLRKIFCRGSTPRDCPC